MAILCLKGNNNEMYLAIIRAKLTQIVQKFRSQLESCILSKIKQQLQHYQLMLLSKKQQTYNFQKYTKKHDHHFDSKKCMPFVQNLLKLSQNFVSPCKYYL